MKVFISWSGHTSHQVAMVLRDWIPSVIQNIQPYVSSEDIDKGARWSTDIAGELDESSFGILSVTKGNISSPWLNFEAGALGKSVDKSRVCPFLFNVKRSEVEGPLLQFQSTTYEKTDVLKLLVSMNKACKEAGIEDGRLVKAFEVWWPSLQKELNKIDESCEEAKEKVPNASKDSSYVEKVLEEMLDLTRTNHKILRTPEALLPPDYVFRVIESKSGVLRKETEDDNLIRDLLIAYLEMIKRVRSILDKCEQNICRDEVLDSLRLMRSPIRYLAKQKVTSISLQEIDKVLG